MLTGIHIAIRAHIDLLIIVNEQISRATTAAHNDV